MNKSKIRSTIINLVDDDDCTFEEVSEIMALANNVFLTPSDCEDIYDMEEDLEMDLPFIDHKNKHIASVMKKVQFIDIETSLITAKVFRTGKQSINAAQLTGTTKILTAAGGSYYDLYTKGNRGVWAVGNQEFDTFEEDPLDDTGVLKFLWKKLDVADVIVAHNATFDKSWILGRFLELGWKLPSKFSVVCTYRNLYSFNMTSKKLDELSHNLIGTNKIKTDMSLWMRCSDGDRSAFSEMMKYNIGDIYDTLFKVYLRTCQYNPDVAVDLSNHNTIVPQCTVTGENLQHTSQKYYNRRNGLEYSIYKNHTNGLLYVNRYNTQSKKSALGLIKQYK